MVNVEMYGEFETAWCPGCGNFALIKCLKKALAGLDLLPENVFISSGIGQAAKTPHYLKCNCFNGLHGRSLPPAQGAKLANPRLTVIAESGDGCHYGEGGNHFLAAIRRNADITMLAHDNQIYGLTKGQASPTTMEGMKTKAQPGGAPSAAFNPVAVAVAMGAGFVARGFVGEADHLTDLIQQAISFKGFAMVDIFQPCVSFNKVNTYAWYKERCYKLEDDHDPSSFEAAMAKAREFGEKIPIGVIYKSPHELFSAHVPGYKGSPLAEQKVDMEAVREVMGSFR